MIRLAALAASVLLVSGGYGSDVTLLQRNLPLLHPHVNVKAFDAAAARLRARLPHLSEEPGRRRLHEARCVTRRPQRSHRHLPARPRKQAGVPRVPVPRLRVRGRRVRHRPEGLQVLRRGAADGRRRRAHRARARADQAARAARQPDDRYQDLPRDVPPQRGSARRARAEAAVCARASRRQARRLGSGADQRGSLRQEVRRARAADVAERRRVRRRPEGADPRLPPRLRTRGLRRLQHDDE